jgi:methionyl aminopeptidase
VLADEWTVVTTDRRWAAHWEHTVAITEAGPWVLTAFDGGISKLAELGVTSGQPVDQVPAGVRAPSGGATVS